MRDKYRRDMGGYREEEKGGGGVRCRDATLGGKRKAGGEGGGVHVCTYACTWVMGRGMNKVPREDGGGSRVWCVG